MHRPVTFILTIFAALNLHMQAASLSDSINLRGRVIDSETGTGLAFVNIVYTEEGRGSTTDIDGYFTLETDSIPGFLRFSYIGYKTFEMDIFPHHLKKSINAEMIMRPLAVEEVTIVPGVNPAHRIIKKTVENRDSNNPERLGSFSYTLYNKLYFTQVPESLISKNNQYDYRTVSSQPGNRYLFLMESVSRREYLRPGRNNEKVIASRVSGFSNPSFTLIATQLQSFTFYDDFVTILDRRYLNPVSRGSTSRYLFILEESIYTPENDTLFVISYQPYPNRNFDGLKGVIYINSNGYAVQNVIAEPYNHQGFVKARIHQNYTLEDGSHWFPNELNSELIFTQTFVPAGANTSYNLIGTGRSYLSDIKIEPELERKNFDGIVLSIADDAFVKDNPYLEKYRNVPLSLKELQAYDRIDSIGREANFDRTLNTIENLLSGYIPWGYLNIDYSSLLDFNHFEGLRSGMRIITNQQFSSGLSLGGHFAWGFKDKRSKYGIESSVSLYKPMQLKLGLSYSNDVKEAGGYSFFGSESITSTERFRRFMIGQMDYSEKYSASVTGGVPGYFGGEIYLNRVWINPGDDYIFSKSQNTFGDITNFYFTETGARLRFSFREKYIKTPRGTLVQLANEYPVIWFNYGRGIKLLDGSYNYTRLSAAFSYTISTLIMGQTTLFLEGGLVDRDVPRHILFSGKGSNRNFSIEAANSFSAMQPGEFISDRFASLFIRHNFGSLLFRSGSFRPDLVFVTNLGIGSLSDKKSHINIPFNTMEKGYIESGILINNILKQLFAGYGIGVFYRYGPYAFEKVSDNLALKITLNIDL